MAKKEIKEKKDSGLTIEDHLKMMRKKFGEESVMMLDQKPRTDVDALSTGSFGLDFALGIGGLPLGRITEIYGMESSGKTTLALHTIAEAQKKGGLCYYIDVEHAMDPEYAKKLGVDTSKLIISQPTTAEEALGMVEAMIQTKEFAVIVVDSVASLAPKAEIEGEMGQQHVAQLPRLLSTSLRKLIAAISHSKTVVLFINQLRADIGAMGYGPKYITPGGKALKFYSSVRLEITRIAQIKKGEEVMGGRTRVKVVKNKVAAPAKVTQFDIMYNEGISREGEILALGEKFNVIKKTGSTYSYAGEKIAVGYDASRVYLKEHKELSEKIIAEIKDRLLDKDESTTEVENSTSSEE